MHDGDPVLLMHHEQDGIAKKNKSKDEVSFVDRVEIIFAFLESEYGFRVTWELAFPMRLLTDGAVEYTSSSIVVAIESDTGYTNLYFYRLQDGRTNYITPIDIHEYLNTSEKEKKLLLSTDPTGRLAASALANEKLLLHQPGWKGSHGTVEDLERELRNFAAWVQEHAGLYVAGDFSRWPAIYEYKINRARADSLIDVSDKHRTNGRVAIFLKEGTFEGAGIEFVQEAIR